MKLKVIESLVQCGYVVGYNAAHKFPEFVPKSYARNTRKEAQDLCDKWEEDIENGLIPNYELL